MTDETPANTGENLEKQPKPGTFKKGFDKRRWLKGAPRVPKDRVEASKIIEHLIWDILSEEIENPVTHEKIDRARAMLRSMTTSRQSADKQAILDRILGKVVSPVDVTSGGEKLPPPQIIEVIKTYKKDGE